MNEVGPPVHVPHPWMARLRHTLDCACRKNVWPHVDIGQRPLEGLNGVEASSNWILFLPKHHRSSTSNGVPFRKSPAVHMQCSIFVELPCAIAVSLRRTNVMPSAVISWFMYHPGTMVKQFRPGFIYFKRQDIQACFQYNFPLSNCTLRSFGIKRCLS